MILYNQETLQYECEHCRWSDGSASRPDSCPKCASAVAAVMSRREPSYGVMFDVGAVARFMDDSTKQHWAREISGLARAEGSQRTVIAEIAAVALLLLDGERG